MLMSFPDVPVLRYAPDTMDIKDMANDIVSLLSERSVVRLNWVASDDVTRSWIIFIEDGEIATRPVREMELIKYAELIDIVREKIYNKHNKEVLNLGFALAKETET